MTARKLSLVRMPTQKSLSTNWRYVDKENTKLKLVLMNLTLSSIIPKLRGHQTRRNNFVIDAQHTLTEVGSEILCLPLQLCKA